VVYLGRAIRDHLRPYLDGRRDGPLFFGHGVRAICARQVQRRLTLWLTRAGVVQTRVAALTSGTASEPACIGGQGTCTWSRRPCGIALCKHLGLRAGGHRSAARGHGMIEVLHVLGSDSRGDTLSSMSANKGSKKIAPSDLDLESRIHQMDRLDTALAEVAGFYADYQRNRRSVLESQRISHWMESIYRCDGIIIEYDYVQESLLGRTG